MRSMLSSTPSVATNANNLVMGVTHGGANMTPSVGQPRGGFFSNLLHGDLFNRAQNGINDFVGGIQLPTVSTNNAIDKQSQNFILMVVLAIGAIFLLTRKKSR